MFYEGEHFKRTASSTPTRHSPGVPVFRDDRGRLLDEPYAAGFLTSPAPNAGVLDRTPDARTRTAFERAFATLLAVSASRTAP